MISTPQSQARQYFRAANGHKTYNEGQNMMTMMTREGTKRDMKFIVCDVSKAFGSGSQMCKDGHRVAFNPPWENEGSYSEHVDIGERMWLEEKGNLYILNARVAPRHRQTGSIQHTGNTWNPGFPGQVNP